MHCVFMSWHITVYAENCSLKENRENKEQKSPFTASSLMAMDIGWWLWHCVFIPGITVYAENCSLKENGENEEQKSTFSLMAMQYIGQ